MMIMMTMMTMTVAHVNTLSILKTFVVDAQLPFATASAVIRCMSAWPVLACSSVYALSVAIVSHTAPPLCSIFNDATDQMNINSVNS
eukprot:5496514-Amphidinium_carterae.1